MVLNHLIEHKFGFVFDFVFMPFDQEICLVMFGFSSKV